MPSNRTPEEPVDTRTPYQFAEDCRPREKGLPPIIRPGITPAKTADAQVDETQKAAENVSPQRVQPERTPTVSRKDGPKRTTVPKRDPSWHHSQTKKYTLASLRGEELLTQLDRVERLMADKGPIYRVAAALRGDMATDTCYALARCARFSESMRCVIAAHGLNSREANLIWEFPDELHGNLAEKMQRGSIPFSRLLRVKWGMHDGLDLPTLLRGAGFTWPKGLSKSLLIPRR